MPGLPGLQYLQEFAQTHVHGVSDAIQPSHPVTPFSFCAQSFPTSGSVLMSHLFSLSGQSTGDSASASILPMNIQGWFPLGLTGLLPCCPRTLKSLLQHHNRKASIFQPSAFFMVQLSHSQSIFYVQNGILLSYTMSWTTETHCNMHEHWKHNTV